MLQRECTQQATAFLQNQNSEKSQVDLDTSPQNTHPFNLITPNSSCPHCQHEIKPHENIPLISFIFLRGKCSQCKQAISWRYPLVELLTATLSMILAWHFGFSWQLAAALVFTYALICLALIDFDTQLLLDSITLPILWLGLLVNSRQLFVPLEDAVLGAVIGYLSLWSVFWLYKFFTGKEGMGYGDFKLMALFGAWMGWQFIPLIILLSSISGAILGSLYLIISKGDRNKSIPFGPYLAVAGWISLLWGQEIIHRYFNLIQL
jgi:leader peptidase (prepilin peptidase) / N-methyltransferase